jgi:hypothetical protein
VLFPWPPPVLGQVGAGGLIVECQTTDGQGGKGRSRHAVRLSDEGP